MRACCSEPYCTKRARKGVSRCQAHACLKNGCDERPLAGRRECKAHAGHAWKGLQRLTQETAAILAVTAPVTITRGNFTARLIRETDAPAIIAALDKIDRAARRRVR